MNNKFIYFKIDKEQNKFYLNDDSQHKQQESNVKFKLNPDQSINIINSDLTDDFLIKCSSNIKFIEGSMVIGIYKILFIFSAACSCMAQYGGISCLSFFTTQVKYTQSINNDEFALLFTIPQLTVVFYGTTTLFADYQGRNITQLCVIAFYLVSNFCLIVQDNKYQFITFQILNVMISNAIQFIDVVFIQEQVSYKIKNNVMMLMFFLEAFGLFVIMAVASQFDNFKAAFAFIIILCILSLLFRVVGVESQMWQNRMGMPKECVESINYVNNIQNDPFYVVQINNHDFAQLKGKQLTSDDSHMPIINENNGQNQYNIFQFKDLGNDNVDEIFSRKERGFLDGLSKIYDPSSEQQVKIVIVSFFCILQFNFQGGILPLTPDQLVDSGFVQKEQVPIYSTQSMFIMQFIVFVVVFTAHLFDIRKTILVVLIYQILVSFFITQIPDIPIDNIDFDSFRIKSDMTKEIIQITTISITQAIGRIQTSFTSILISNAVNTENRGSFFQLFAIQQSLGLFVTNEILTSIQSQDETLSFIISNIFNVISLIIFVIQMIIFRDQEEILPE